MPKLMSRAAQSIQKAVSPKPAKVGKQPGKVTAPKTKMVKKAVPNKGKKIMGHNKKLAMKGKPLTKGKVKGMQRSIK